MCSFQFVASIPLFLLLNWLLSPYIFSNLPLHSLFGYMNLVCSQYETKNNFFCSLIFFFRKNLTGYTTHIFHHVQHPNYNVALGREPGQMCLLCFFLMIINNIYICSSAGHHCAQFAWSHLHTCFRVPENSLYTELYKNIGIYLFNVCSPGVIKIYVFTGMLLVHI